VVLLEFEFSRSVIPRGPSLELSGLEGIANRHNRRIVLAAPCYSRVNAASILVAGRSRGL